jgi:protein O-GlcNAc transferase
MSPELTRAIDLHQRGCLDEAEAGYRAFLQRHPDNFLALHQLGLINLQRGEYRLARELVIKSLQFAPGFSTAYLTLGAIDRELGHLSASLNALDEAVRLEPQNPKTHASRALTCLAMKSFRQAVADLHNALLLGGESADWRQAMGVSLQALGELDAALTHYQRSAQLNPRLVKPWFNQGLIHYERRRWLESLHCFQRARELDPSDTIVLGNCAELLEKLGRHDESLAAYQQLIECRPNHALAHYNIGHEWHRRNEFERALDSYNRALEIDPDLMQARGNRIFIKQTTGWSIREVKAEAIEYGRRASSNAQPKFTGWTVQKDPSYLRVGLVSADFRNHSVGSLLVSVLPQLANERIELYAYQVGGRDDAVTEKMRPWFAHWRKLSASDHEDAKIIHGDAIHILIDLSGYTRGSRLPLFAYKPAPVQATWLGYWGTTGLPEIDYILTDPYSTPSSDETQYTERVWRLPQTRWCFTEPEGAPARGDLPFDRNGFVTFGVFNHYRKFTPQLVDCWCSILKAIPDARLIVKNNAFREAQFIDQATATLVSRGIDRSRLILEGPESRSLFLARLNEVDISLDTFPAAGGLTTLDSLWMGVPVVACQGQDMLSRQSGLILGNLGLHSWLARDADHYVELAVDKASQLGAIRVMRPQLRSQLQRSALMDAPRFARDLANAFWGMWSKYCAISRD